MKRLREMRGMSKAELVRALTDAGWTNVHQTTVTRIENGERPARIGEARVIAAVLETTVGKLIREPVQAAIEDDLERSNEGLRNSYNKIIEGVVGVLHWRESVERALGQASSGVWVDENGTVHDVPMTPRLRQLIHRAELLGGYSIEAAEQNGRKMFASTHSKDHVDTDEEEYQYSEDEIDALVDMGIESAIQGEGFL
ncbi:hypothetical protein AWN90_40455 [Nocardia terpenica]|uniref:HTH cro/C1-type domain-containing protein n=2 Tax=Nocardia terpenica TaxID=455432 RepID=A0A164JXN6_9NOCA|nr:hypothetical protein AWN90_40455 [Nocardia terpenica]